jgi:hypothetical protein
MTSFERGAPGGEEDNSAALLDQVMRGERRLPFPPGTVAASLVIPCFALGIGSLMMFVGITISRGRTAIVASIAAATVLTGVAIAGHILVVRGRPRHRAWMRAYVRSLIGCAVAGAAVGSVSRVFIPWPLVIIAGALLGVCDALLGSRAYLAFSSFLSLKRQYREDEASARDRVLGSSRTKG